MLKTLKWIYGLGVNHERERISGYLQAEAQRASNFTDVADVMLSEPRGKKEITEKRKKKLELQVAVENRVQEIVHDMFRSQNEQYIPGDSFMFPDDSKGKVK